MHLSKRELEVLKLIILGKNYREIAHDLFVSINTILTHRKNIKSKLGVKSSAGIVREAVNQGYYSFVPCKRIYPYFK